MSKNCVLVDAAGLEVTGTAPASSGLDQLPPDIHNALTTAGTFVFDHAFVQSMHVTLAVPVAVMAGAALSVLAVKRLRSTAMHDTQSSQKLVANAEGVQSSSVG